MGPKRKFASERERKEGKAKRVKLKKLEKQRRAATAPAPTPQPQKAIKSFESGQANVLRGLKKAKGFERQRLSKRISEEKQRIAKQLKKNRKKKNQQEKSVKAERKNGAETLENAADGRPGDGPAEAAPCTQGPPAGPPPPQGDAGSEKLQRLMREVETLKHLDLRLAARIHLSHVLLRVKELADAAGPLAEHLNKATVVSAQDQPRWQTTDVHNVASALYNRSDVREAVAQAVRRVCLRMCVAIPERYQLAPDHGKKGKGKSRSAAAADDDDYDSDGSDMEIIDDASDDDSEEDSDSDDDDDDDDDERGSNSDAESDADQDPEEAALAKYKSRLGGGSSDDEDSDDDDDDDVVDGALGFYMDETPSHLMPSRRPEQAGGHSSDSSSISSNDDDGETPPPPQRKAATAAAPIRVGDSRFLPSLMGGYVSASDGEGGSDEENAVARMLAPARKNRRGQKARQATWEKKYKDHAKHLQRAQAKEAQGGGGAAKKKGSGDGWDAKRGAVDASDAPRWLRRKMGITKRKLDAEAGATAPRAEEASASARPGGSSSKKKDDTGTLHPSWEAAKKAKEKAQAVAFEGKKVVFD